MSDLIPNLILVAGLLTAIGLTFLSLFSKRVSVKKYLSLFFLTIFLEIFGFYAHLHDNQLFANIGYLLSDGFGPFGPIFLWLFVRETVGKPIKSRVLTYHLILPFLFLLVTVLPISISLFSKSWVSDFHRMLAYNNDLVVLCYSFIHIGYLSFSFYELQKFLNIGNLQNDRSSVNWLKMTCVGGVLLFTLDSSTTVYEYAFGQISWNVGFITIIALCLTITAAGVYGLKQQNVILATFMPEKQVIENLETCLQDRVYLKRFNNSEILGYREEMLKAMRDQKLFLKPGLVLTDLADEVGLTTKQTTELLNFELETNFYDFVNDYRVEEVKNRIVADEFKHLTLLAIGLDSGFQSKSSFNRVFKNRTGMSPSEYKKSKVG